MKRELRLFAGLLPAIFQDLRAAWSDDVVATDASEWGLGAVVSRSDPELIAASGRICERKRFRAGENLGGARAQSGSKRELLALSLASTSRALRRASASGPRCLELF